MEQCPHHVELVIAQARTESKVDTLIEHHQRLETMLTGVTGTNGVIGWMNQTKGRTAVWGAIGGMIIVVVGAVVRGMVRYF